ncbi:hypothetical protein BKA63DRAFT_139424 [Paraphoma chrysanthemicola]|nr:hypothetical protein BKA63DRAFT_139424 [Paraphoma chrysanthemicola]
MKFAQSQSHNLLCYGSGRHSHGTATCFVMLPSLTMAKSHSPARSSRMDRMLRCQGRVCRWHLSFFNLVGLVVLRTSSGRLTARSHEGGSVIVAANLNILASGLSSWLGGVRAVGPLTADGGKIVSTSAHAWRTRPRADSCDDVCARGHTWAGLERRLAGRNKALVAQSQEMKPKLCAPSDYLLMRNYLWLPRRMCRGSGARGRLFLGSGLCRQTALCRRV